MICAGLGLAAVLLLVRRRDLSGRDPGTLRLDAFWAGAALYAGTYRLREQLRLPPRLPAPLRAAAVRLGARRLVSGARTGSCDRRARRHLVAELDQPAAPVRAADVVRGAPVPAGGSSEPAALRLGDRCARRRPCSRVGLYVGLPESRSWPSRSAKTSRPGRRCGQGAATRSSSGSGGRGRRRGTRAV